MSLSIPKTIHYCWFGGKELGPDEQKCIASWKRYLPNYEIVRWDESNYDLNCNDYVKEAYSEKKWAFVSDYARFDVLYHHGGLYFDTDVELISSIDDLIDLGPFMCCESMPVDGKGLTVAPGLGLAAYPNMSLYKEVMQSFNGQHFIDEDGNLNEQTIVVRVTDILRSHGLVDSTGIQDVDGIRVYPSDYFNPKDYLTGNICCSDNTRSIHHFSMSWFSEAEKYKYSIGVWLRNHGIKGVLAFKISGLASKLKWFKK